MIKLSNRLVPRDSISRVQWRLRVKMGSACCRDTLELKFHSVAILVLYIFLAVYGRTFFMFPTKQSI
jgi:hypothetical protein